MIRAGALAAAWALLAGAALAQPALKAPLTAGLRLTDPASGAALAQVQPGQPFDVQLEFRAQVGSVPTDLAPLAWIRQRGPGDLPCAETAAAYRAAGRAALGSVDLNGIVLGMVARDGAFTVLDPQRALGTANLLTARRFDPPPSALAADPRSGAFLLALPGAAPGQGLALALDPYGQPRLLAEGLQRPAALVPAASGGGWLLDAGAGTVLRLDRGAPQPMAAGARAIAGDAGTRGTGRLAVLAGDELLVLRDDGAVQLRSPAPGALAVALGPEAALWLDPEALHVVWLDAPDAAQRIALPGAFDRLALSPEGRMAFLFARDRTGFAVADLALGRVVQGAATDSPVAEVGFLPGTAVLRLADQSGVGVMDLRRIAPGHEAVVGHVALGPPRPAAEARDAALLAPYLPEPVMLAVHADSYSGFVVDRRHAISGKPPMEALRLRGGIPQMLRALNRGLRPLGSGRFVTTTRLPGPGDWELVVSAGIGQMAFCAPVPTPPTPAAAQAQPGRISPEADAAGRIRLRFLAGDGRPAAGLSGMVELAALTGNWRQRQPFSTDAGGLSAESYDLAPHVPLVVTAGGAGFEPLVLETAP
ncbi:hypothetical protein SAMN04488021_12819 [Paracoccus aminovorans]|uniref:Uncharacterized protein n=1 Tax=Paracoccus aminovorans TaxID=34004 RepID=A0A1I3C5V3_9RHOB|nr:hypothetical protein [Paracoccus aminovorans]CQR84483.1 hypothetical protein JCM7685_pAMV3p0538 [Paracoccus aminovorans]SFH69965.1 hypothetical protein SAMN04488021_12819 [Paracoccus aminovorans]